MKTYQELFNNTVTKIRIAVGACVDDESPLMRSIVKTLYNFSDDLIAYGIIENREQKGSLQK